MSVGTWSLFHTPYSEREVRRYAPTGGGVYLLWVRHKNRKWECVYVGTAENIQGGLVQHLKPDEPNKGISERVRSKCGFNWIEITTEAERLGTAKFLYDAYHPECNTVEPSAKRLKIRLPPAPPATSVGVRITG